MKFIRFSILSIFILIPLTSCDQGYNYEKQAQKLKEFFAADKLGSSPDYAVYKYSTDYVISVHGFINDLEVCIKIADFMNQTDGISAYNCQPLNQ